MVEKLRPRAVIFDLGSTLIEYEKIPWDELSPHCVEAARRFLMGKGFDLPGEREFDEAFVRIRQGYRNKAETNHVEWDVPQVLADLLDECAVKYDSSLLDAIFIAYYQPVSENLYIFDDTIESLQKIREMFHRVGLISNTVFPERTHLEEMSRFGIRKYFDFTLFSSTFRLRKPHPDIFYKGANLAGCAPSECLYVGDRYLEDIQGPGGVDMPAILKIKPGREYPESMPDSVRRINRLSELFEHIEN